MILECSLPRLLLLLPFYGDETVVFCYICVKNHIVFVFTTILLTAWDDKMLIPPHPPVLQNGNLVPDKP